MKKLPHGLSCVTMGISSILFLVFTLISFGIFLLLFIAAGRENIANNNLIEFPVSVVVASKDNKAGLDKLLKALSKQHYSNYEVVVVNDRSNDGTSDFLQNSKSNYNWLRTVSIEKVPDNLDPKKYALTKGIEKAKHDIILLTDSDCIPLTNKWISGMANLFDEEETQIVLGYSTYETKPGLLNYFIRFETLWTAIQYMASALLGNPYMGVGRNIAYRKSFFIDKGGFKNFVDVTGGDDDLFVNAFSNRKNTKVALGGETVTVSIPKSSWKELLEQKLRHLSIGQKYRLSDKLILGFFNFIHLGTFLLTVTLIVKSPVLYWLASFLLVRWLLMMAVTGRWGGILGSSINIIGVPILDILYLFYYIFTGIRVLFIKKVKWT